MNKTTKEDSQLRQPLSPSSKVVDTNSVLEQLSADFHPREVRQRSGRGSLKLDYIGIDTTINRLNEVLGAEWDAEIVQSSVYPLPGAEDKNGNPLYLASVCLVLSALGSKRSGTGASVGSDPDDAIKIAQAEALKKAGNLFGIALYLWDEGKRDEIGAWRKSQKNTRGSSTKVAGTTRMDSEPVSEQPLFEF